MSKSIETEYETLLAKSKQAEKQALAMMRRAIKTQIEADTNFDKSLMNWAKTRAILEICEARLKIARKVK